MLYYFGDIDGVVVLGWRLIECLLNDEVLLGVLLVVVMDVDDYVLVVEMVGCVGGGVDVFIMCGLIVFDENDLVVVIGLFE